MTTHSPLDNLSGPGKALKTEAPDAAELAGLIRTGKARLADARNTTLALESRFDLAYNVGWNCGCHRSPQPGGTIAVHGPGGTAPAT